MLVIVFSPISAFLYSSEADCSLSVSFISDSALAKTSSWVTRWLKCVISPRRQKWTFIDSVCLCSKQRWHHLSRVGSFQCSGRLKITLFKAWVAQIYASQALENWSLACGWQRGSWLISNSFIYAMTLVSSGFIRSVQGRGVFAEEVHGRSRNKYFPRTMQDCPSTDFLLEVVIHLFRGFYEQIGQMSLRGDWCEVKEWDCRCKWPVKSPSGFLFFIFCGNWWRLLRSQTPLTLRCLDNFVNTWKTNLLILLECFGQLLSDKNTLIVLDTGAWLFPGVL